MEPMTLREAAQRTSRSITTLRRYIRNGRLKAEKRQGRFGPEYFVSEWSLAEAGLDAEPRAERSNSLARRPASRPEVSSLSLRGSERLLRDSVPMSLFQELQMKHEQLLVQYGMVRAGGLRVMQLQADLESHQAEYKLLQAKLEAQARAHQVDLEQAQQRVHRAELEQEARGLEIAALHEKVRALEMLTRNAVTNESIEKQYSEVMAQSRRVEKMTTKRAWKINPPVPGRIPPSDEQNH